MRAGGARLVLAQVCRASGWYTVGWIKVRYGACVACSRHRTGEKKWPVKSLRNHSLTHPLDAEETDGQLLHQATCNKGRALPLLMVLVVDLQFRDP